MRPHRLPARTVLPLIDDTRELGYRLRATSRDLVAEEPSSGQRLRVVRLSPVDLSLITSDPERLPLERGCHLLVHPDIDPIAARFDAARPTAASGVSEVRVCFDDIALRAGSDLQALLLRLRRSGAIATPDEGPREVERIVDGTRVRAILRALFANRSRGNLVALGARPVRLRAAQIAPHHRHPLHLELDGAWPEPRVTVELEGYNSLFRFEADAVADADGFFALPVPRELLRIRRRSNRWTPAPGGVEVSFRHPVWPQLFIRRPLRDLSFDGIGFTTSAASDLLYPGLAVDEVVLEWGDRLRIELSGVVRHVSPDAGGAAEIAGMRLVPRTPDDELRWRQELKAQLFPHTRMDGTWSRELWSLYERSGYFGLSEKSSASFTHLREPFEKVSRLVAARPDLGCQVVWPSRRGAEAAISLLKIYRTSTFIYQLARQHGRTPASVEGRKILRDIYLHAIEHTLRDPSLRWLVAWVQESARFSRLVHHDLPQRYLADGRTFIERFHAMGGACGAPVAAPQDGVEVARAGSGEIDALLEVLSTRSPLFLEAHDLVRDRMDLADIGRTFSGAGLVRGREIRVARRGGRAIAAAVIEIADDGLHLFGLLDVVRVFALVPGGEAAFPSLLEAVRAFYTARGKRSFVYYCEAGHEEHARTVGFEDLGAADLTILPVELLPELLEHVHELTAPRDVPALPAVDDA